MSDLMPATTTISGNEYSAAAAAAATANGEGSSSHHQQQQTTKTSTSTIIGGGGTATSPNFSNPANMQTTATSAGLNLAFTNPKGAKLLADFKQIILELRAQNFDVIRFATYRTASKLRFIQKKLNLHLIDLWNVIETFRDNNFHTLDVLSELEMSKVEQCIQNMYIQLNKRLALNQQINVETQTQLLLAWLFCLYDKSRLARIKLFSLKVVLTTLCSGKLVDKLKYTFNQISEHNKNLLSMHKFDLYLRELLVLPKAVFEEPSFGYNDAMARSCFDANTPVRIEDFLSVALSDVGPPCFIWLNIFHRFINVQSVVHPVTCSACERTNFIGFRYKCQKCRKYQLCQDCFWRGRISHSHQLTHQMKEYTSYKSTAKQISNSLKRSFFCKPNKQVPPSSSSSMNNGPHTHHYHHQTSASTTAAATKSGSIRTMPNYQQQTTNRQTPTTSGSKPMSSTTPTSAPYQMPPSSGSPLPPHQTQSHHHHHHHHHHQTGQQQQQPAITLLGGLQQPIPSVGANNSSSATAASNSALNNSDYNLIYGYQQSSHHHHQQQPPPKLHTHQTLSNITNNATTNGGIPVTSSLPLNPSELLYSKLPKSPKTKKLLVHTNGATSNGGTPILDDNEDDESSPTIHELSSAQLHQQQQQQQKSIDLTHLLPSVALNAHNELQQQQILRQQAAAASNTGNYSNTLSMTRTKNTDNINSTLNLFASFLLSNPNLNNIVNSTSSNGGVGINNGETVSTNNVAQTQQEEHNIIANYCSRLAQYYAQNPHLAQSSPTNTTSPTPQQQQQHQMQPPPAQPQMGIQSRTSSLSRQQQHHYQQSNRSKYSTLRPCQVPITTATAIGPTNRSLSESNFACNGDDEDETGVVNEYSLDDRLLKEKREIVAKLERQNREIAKEIKRLRMRQSSNQYLDLYSTDSSDYMSPSSAAAAANSSSSSSAAAATIRYQQLLQQYQQQQQRSAAATAAAVNAYSNIYSTTKSRETTPATVKKPIDPNLIAELRNLKVKKGELDTRMQILINSRDQLMDRLAQLDLLIKTPSNTTTTTTNNSQQQQQQQPQTNKQQQIPATATTTATTTSSNGQPSGSHSRSWSTPSTPAAAHYEFHHPNRHVYNQYQQQPTATATTSTTNAYQQQQRLYGHYGNAISQQTSLLSLTGGSLANSSAGGLNDSIDSGGSSLRILRNDLLIAADSVTNAMQTLVNELNSEDVINDNFDRVTAKLENSENGHHYHHINPTNLNGDSSNVINDGEEEAIYRLQQQQQIYRNNIPTSSVSASATPVTYRKYHFHHQQQQQQPTVNNNTTTSNTSNTHRNAINLDDFGVDYLSTNGGGGGENNSAEIHEISAQILNGFNSNVNNNNENNEDDIRTAYMESFIDELSKKEIISGLQMSCNPTEIDLDEVEQNLMMCNLGENSEQIAEWRRELEQVLTDQQQQQQQQQQQNDSAAAQNTKSSTIESNNNANTNNSN